VSTVAEAEEASRTGFAVVPLRALGAEGETTLNQAGASVRLLTRRDGTLPGADEDGPDADLLAVVSRAY
jgi:prolyl-tRNA synthetase